VKFTSVDRFKSGAVLTAAQLEKIGRAVEGLTHRTFAGKAFGLELGPASVTGVRASSDVTLVRMANDAVYQKVELVDHISQYPSPDGKRRVEMVNLVGQDGVPANEVVWDDVKQDWVDSGNQVLVTAHSPWPTPVRADRTFAVCHHVQSGKWFPLQSYTVRYAKTCKSKIAGAQAYPANGSPVPNVFGIEFVSGVYKEEAGRQTPVTGTMPRDPAGVPHDYVMNLGDAYVPEGTVVECKFIDGQWYTLVRSAAAGSSSGAPCSGLGWLRSGPRSNKAIRITFLGSAGLCDCTPAQAAGDIYATWKSGTATTDTFEIIRNLKFCGGCAYGEITVDHAATPLPTAKVTLTFYSCLDGTLVTRDYYAHCGDDGYFVIDLFDTDLCGEPGGLNCGGPGHAEYPCFSYVRIKAECIPPPVLDCSCPGCAPAQTPLAFKWTDYADGFVWYLNRDAINLCTFASVCPSSPTLAYNSGTVPPRWELSAHGHTWAVVEDDFDCCTGGTLALVGGPIMGVPDTVSVTVAGPTCAASCCVYADMPDPVYVTSAHFGATRTFTKRGSNNWIDADLPDPGLSCDGPPPTFGPEELTLDPATCKFTLIWAASCCGGSPAGPKKATSLQDPFLVEYTYHDDFPLEGCPSDDTITISETVP
jgi:hypothetical protein